MPDKLIWWPRKMADTLQSRTIVLMRYDWPDGERIYQLGIFDAEQMNPWRGANDGALEAPDYFAVADGEKITRFLVIPPEQEHTYGPKVKD